MNDILKKITEHKFVEVKQKKEQVSIKDMLSELSNIDSLKQTYSLKESICRKRNGPAIIAEFKRGSPSKGLINSDVSSFDVITGYIKAGAAGISILTDEKFFFGKLDDIPEFDNPTAPFLRKDFIVDEYQIYEARYNGVDAILLIAAILSNEKIIEFTKLAHKLNLEVLLEIHNEDELAEKFHDKVDLVGINNRNLATFKVDIGVSKHLIKLIPKGTTVISESGINTKDEINSLLELGFSGFLIGESFMRETDPAKALAELLNSL